MQIVNILHVPYMATIRLQEQDITLSDAFGIYVEIKLRLKKIIATELIKTNLAASMLNAVEKRFEKVLANPAMTAAIFLDPRYRLSLMNNHNSIQTAKEFIIDLHKHLISLKNQNINDLFPQISFAQNNDNMEFDIQAEIDQLWGNNSQSCRSNNISDIEAALDVFDPPSMKITNSVLKYWNENSEYAELRDVAMAIFAISPTEVQVERDFSCLKRTLSDLRFNLSTKTLEDILTIMLNKELYLGINAKQIENIRKAQA